MTRYLGFVRQSECTQATSHIAMKTALMFPLLAAHSPETSSRSAVLRMLAQNTRLRHPYSLPVALESRQKRLLYRHKARSGSTHWLANKGAAGGRLHPSKRRASKQDRGACGSRIERWVEQGRSGLHRPAKAATRCQHFSQQHTGRETDRAS